MAMPRRYDGLTADQIKNFSALTAAQRFHIRYPDRGLIAVRKWEKNNPEKVAEYAKRAYVRNREKRLAGQKKWYEDNRDRVMREQKLKRKNRPEMFLYYSAKTRAKKKGLAFSISITDIIIPERCPILGVRIVTGGGKGWHQNSPSLDRVIPSRGYTKNNIAVISHRANRIKSDGTIEELVKIIKYIRKITKK